MVKINKDNCLDVLDNKMQYLRTSHRWLYLDEINETKQELKEALKVAINTKQIDSERDKFKIMACRMMIECNLDHYKPLIDTFI